MKTGVVVLNPTPGICHMVSMVELGKLILKHHPSSSITVLVTTPPQDTSTTISSYITTTQANLPRITFYTLPSINPLAGITPFEFIRVNVPGVIAALKAISRSSKVEALITSVVDKSCYDCIVPTYYFFTSCASCLSALLHLPTIYDQNTKSPRELDETLLDIPGLPPIKASQLPDRVLDRDTEVCRYFLDLVANLPKSNGIILNTFDSLEPRAIKAVAQRENMPPIYCIGPVIADSKDRPSGSCTSTAASSNSGVDLHAPQDCLLWLDKQPSKSVVFLCFGSKKGGCFSIAQLREIAVGLERSEERFLWVVKMDEEESSNSELEKIMPDGFFERTKDKGLVLTSWVPQAEILDHQSIGGFVTHCGWNSVIEAVSKGVPMVAWPLYAEQRLNRVVLVEEMKVAIAIDEEESNDGLVSWKVIERRVKELMREGRGLRRRIEEMKGMCSAAWEIGGSSLLAFSNLAGSWNQH
ncbi:hypothetical protein LguiA_002402 [Lonicera macranthoides]